MTRDDMMMAFRMIAMGRPSTPHVEALADFLLGVKPEEPQPEPVVETPPEMIATVQVPVLPVFPTAEQVEEHQEAKEQAAVERKKPGRPKKVS